MRMKQPEALCPGLKNDWNYSVYFFLSDCANRLTINIIALLTMVIIAYPTADIDRPAFMLSQTPHTMQGAAMATVAPATLIFCFKAFIL